MSVQTRSNSENLFSPSPADYRPSLPLEAELRRPVPEQAKLAGSGTIVDNGHDKWHFMVAPGTPGVLTLQLQVSNEVIWFKSIVVSTNFFGSWYQIRTLGTHDDERVATVDLTQADAQSGTLKLDFWRAGFLNIGAYVTTMVIDVPSNLGSTLIFMCDGPKDR